MNWPSGVQWEWAIGEFVVLGFLFWELHRLRRTQRRDREEAMKAKHQGQITPSRCRAKSVRIGLGRLKHMIL